MKPITHAKIKFYTFTICNTPRAVWLFLKVVWNEMVAKNKEKTAQYLKDLEQLPIEREAAVVRVYKFHTKGYEFVLRSK